MDLSWVGVRGGADGVIASLQEGQLGEQQSGRHLDGRELLQHLHQRRVVVPLPLFVLLQALNVRETDFLQISAELLAGRLTKAGRSSNHGEKSAAGLPLLDL